ncbi:MAG TPA: zinc ABC transporter substrate-binding protein [Actinomycetota bacterium]|jgi:zinc transport system substrate-binding protein|nr:zinc ABC transporter substrate-binding protein [Actinomycetota bacterium]
MVRAILSLVLVSVVVTAAGCGGDGASDARPGETIAVAASFYPLAFAAEQVGGDAVAVENLTPPGAEPHDLELTPGDLETIASAHVVVMVRGGFQPAVEEAVESEASGIVVDALEGVEVPSSIAADGDADGPEVDPHVWLDPMIFADVVERVASALGRVDRGAAGGFDDAAARLRSRLVDLDRDFRRGLAECRTRTMITNHAAFGHLAAAYDLEQVPIAGLSPEAEPGPERIAELAARAEAAGATTIFTEDLAPSDVAETLAAEAGIDTAVLSPLEGLTADQLAAGDDYLSVMRTNLETLRYGLDCA